MAMDMSPDEFWYGDPFLCQSYRLAFSLKREEDIYRAWLGGMYVYEAVSTALFNAFRGKNTEPMKYVDAPEFKRKKQEKSNLTPEQENELALAKAEVWMMNFFGGSKRKG